MSGYAEDYSELGVLEQQKDLGQVRQEDDDSRE